MHVAVDGWHLAASASTPEAWRTRELLELSGPDVEGWHWSAIGPAVSSIDLPSNVRAVEAACPAGGWGHLAFEQLALPRAAARLGADVLLTLAGAPPSSSRVPMVMEYPDHHHGRPGVSGRFRRAMRTAASLGATTFTWSDLPEVDPGSGTAVRLTPWTADRFRPTAEAEDAPIRARLGLEDGYVLASAVGKQDVTRLLSAWSWVAPSVGEAHPMVLIGMRAAGDRAFRQLGERLGLADTLRLVDSLGYVDLPAVMRGAAALLIPGEPVDGQLLRWALAAGMPVAAAASAEAESILGEAGYVTPAGDARALGAACLSLLVETDLSESLREAGVRRAARYHSGRGVEELAWVLRRAAHLD